VFQIFAWLLFANWMIYGTFVIFSGGSALCGEVSGGEFLICRHAMTRGSVAVTEGFWLFSLIYGSITIGLTPFVLATMFTFSVPRWAGRGFGYLSIAVALVLMYVIMVQAMPRFGAWIAA